MICVKILMNAVPEVTNATLTQIVSMFFMIHNMKVRYSGTSND